MRRASLLGVLVLVPVSAIAAESIGVEQLFEGATKEQAQVRAALVDASWDLPEDVLNRIQGVDVTDAEWIEENLQNLVDPENANVRLPFVDLAVGSPGPEATVQRTYNSRYTAASELGAGWSWSFGTKITKLGNDLLLRDRDGSETVFTARGKGEWVSTVLGQRIATKNGGYLRTATNRAEAERFDRDGYLMERIDGDGRKLTVLRDRSGRPQTIVAANGRRLSVEVDNAGRIVEMADPAGRKAIYSYDGQGRLSKTSVNGLETAYAYDAEGQLSQVTFPAGNVLSIDYTPAGWAEELRMGNRAVRASFTTNDRAPNVHGASINVDGATTKYLFDENAGRAEITGEEGTEVRTLDRKRGVVAGASRGADKSLYQHDELGRLVKMRATDGTLAYTYGPRAVKTMDVALDGGIRTHAEFDDAGNVTRMVEGNRTFEVKYAAGLPVEVRLNGAVLRRSEYAANGDLIAITDENGRTTRIGYDAAGWVTSLERVGAAKIEIAPQPASFLPKIRVTRNLPAGPKAEVLQAPEMQFLYGELSEAKPTKRASLDSIPGTKFAGIGMLPAAGAPILAGCNENIFFCGTGYALKCFAVRGINDISPVGTPFEFDPKTGEYKYIGLKEWGLDQLKSLGIERTKDGGFAVAKHILKEGATKGSGFWRKAAARARQAWAIGKKLGKKLAAPIKIIMLIPTAYQCGKETSAADSPLCTPDRLCLEEMNPQIPRRTGGTGASGGGMDASFIRP